MAARVYGKIRTGVIGFGTSGAVPSRQAADAGPGGSSPRRTCSSLRVWMADL